MAPWTFKLLCAVALLFLVSSQTRASNINIDESCPRTGQGCQMCLSRNSDEIERCQQLFFYVSFTTTDNQAQIESYCSGDCPIILSTAYYYCDSEADIPELFTMCPSYSVEPSGSFSVDVTFDVDGNEGSCLSSSQSQCLECIGDDTQDAVRCLQAYLLARYSNSSSSYSSQYCNSSCPLVLQSFAWYCGDVLSVNAYDFCQQTESQVFCGDLERSTEGSLSAAAAACSADCTSVACNASISQFGCCLRQELGSNQCLNIPNCTLSTVGTTQDIRIDGDCTFAANGCTQCLSRNSNELEECFQLYTFIYENRNLQSSSANAEVMEFCSGECPILLATADFYCGSISRLSIYLQFCPAYDVIPSASVEITANFSGQNCLASNPKLCLECIASNSPEPTRCLQLYLLLNEETDSSLYIDEFCTGNCPLTLSTTAWYCNLDQPQTIFSVCNRTAARPGGQYCRDLTRNTTAFSQATADCLFNCTTEECNTAIEQYGCCLSSNGEVNDLCNISTCSVETAGAPILLTSASLLTTLLCALIYSLFL